MSRVFLKETLILYLRDPENFPLKLLVDDNCPECKGEGIVGLSRNVNEFGKQRFMGCSKCYSLNLVELISQAKALDVNHFKRMVGGTKGSSRSFGGNQ